MCGQEGLLTVVVVNDLKVFDGSLGDTAVEVQHVGLGVVVPHGRLVVQLDQVVQRAVLPPAQEALLLLCHMDKYLCILKTAQTQMSLRYHSQCSLKYQADTRFA